MEFQNFDTSACAHLREWVSEKCNIAEEDPKWNKWFECLSKIENIGIDISHFHDLYESMAISNRFSEMILARFLSALKEINTEFAHESRKIPALMSSEEEARAFVKGLSEVIHVIVLLIRVIEEEFDVHACAHIRSWLSERQIVEGNPKWITWFEHLSKIETARTDISAILALQESVSISNRFSRILLTTFCDSLDGVQIEFERESCALGVLTSSMLEDQDDFVRLVSQVVDVLDSSLQIAKKELLYV